MKGIFPGSRVALWASNWQGISWFSRAGCRGCSPSQRHPGLQDHQASQGPKRPTATYPGSRQTCQLPPRFWWNSAVTFFSPEDLRHVFRFCANIIILLAMPGNSQFPLPFSYWRHPWGRENIYSYYELISCPVMCYYLMFSLKQFVRHSVCVTRWVWCSAHRRHVLGTRYIVRWQ